MTNINLSRKSIILTALALFGGLAVSSLNANAGVTDNLLHCQANTKQRVVSCCERELYQQKKPIWFTENHASCSSIAVCTKKKQPNSLTFVAMAVPVKCYLQIPHNSNQGSGPGAPPLKQGRGS